MTVSFSDQVVEAFREEAGARWRARFVGLWQRHVALLGALPPSGAASVIEAALALGQQVGVDQESEDDRLFVLAAAQRLHPQPTAEQLLLIIDAVFMPLPVDERLVLLAQLREPSR